MRCAALQFDVRRGEFARNLDAAREGLRQAAREGCRLVVLPEMWPSSFPEPEADLERLTREDEASVRSLAQLAGELGLAFCGSSFGAIEHGDGESKPANRWQFFDGERALAAYDKVHLFSPTAEPESFSAGCEPPAVADTRLGRIGGLICYDLRFPQLTRRLFDAGAQMVCISAQWPAARAAHFRALAIGLAVVEQCFVVAANRCGTEAIGRRAMVLEFPGNSLIVDPHGAVLAEGRGESGLVSAEIELDVAREMRVRVPVAKDQRRELYARWDERGAGELVSSGF